MADAAAMQSQSKTETQRDRETWSTEIDWYLNCRDAACGVASSFASQIAAIERGGAGGTGSVGDDGNYIHPYNDTQVGMRNGQRAFAMDRRMRIRWMALDSESKAILYVHYTGAFPSGGKGQGGRQRWPKGVEARLGEFAGAALFLALREGKLEKVLKACEKGDDVALKGITRRAEAAIRSAHAAYYTLTDNEAREWASGRPNVPGIATVHEAPEPYWMDPEWVAAGLRNEAREAEARKGHESAPELTQEAS